MSELESVDSPDASEATAVDGDDVSWPDLNGFVIEGLLGHGGMGTVFHARDLALDRHVALKFLRDHLADDLEARRRFWREAGALARVKHPNVVPIHALLEQDEVPFMVMGFVDGPTLRDVLAGAVCAGDFAQLFARGDGSDRAALPDLAAALVGLAIAEALAELHSAGIIHRDVKPSNIVIDANGRPMLVDFGIACDPSSPRLQCDAISTGTVGYMPPEYLDGGAIQVDERSDVYSLGLTLFEMLTRRRAFEQEQLDELIAAVVQTGPDAVRVIEPSVDVRLEEIVARATDRDRSRRYQSASELADDLRAAIGRIAPRCELLDGRLDRERLWRAVRDDRGRWARLREWMR